MNMLQVGHALVSDWHRIIFARLFRICLLFGAHSEEINAETSSCSAVCAAGEFWRLYGYLFRSEFGSFVDQWTLFGIGLGRKGEPIPQAQ